MHCDTNRTQLRSRTGECHPRFGTLFSPGGLQNKMPPLSSLRRRRHPVFCTALFALLSCLASCGRSHLTVDGRFDDWPDAPCRVVVEDSRLWIDLRTDGQPVNLQQLPEPMQVRVELDDGATQTIELTFSPEPGNMGVAMNRVLRNGRRESGSPYELDVMFAPTTASTRFELVVDLSPLMKSDGVVRLLDAPCDEFIEISDHPTPRIGSANIPTCEEDAIRIVSWNVQFGELLKQRARAGSILQSLDPDVLLLQELEDDQTTAELCTFLDETLGTDAGSWHATASPVGSRLRSMVAVRAAKPSAPTNPITVDGEPVRVAFLPFFWRQRLWLAGSIHLQCCGGVGGPQDDTRIAQSAAINDEVDRIMASGNFAGVIMGGDLNLVGSETPLQMLIEGRDRNGDDAMIADGMQLDGRSAVTWSDATSRFTPGRLDWLIYTGSSLRQSRSFVLDCEDLSPESRSRHGLQPTDTAAVSDHLPLILDVSIR